jgi:hypothetical protein
VRFSELSSIKHHESEQAIAIRDAYDRPRCRYRLSRNDRRSLRLNNREDSHAANLGFRVSFGQATCETLSRVLCSDETDVSHIGDVFFLTVLDNRGAREINSGPPDLTQLKRHIRRGLTGLTYFGMIDVAHYSNLAEGVRFSGKRCLYWHFHAIVWGISESSLRARVRKLNKTRAFVPIADGFKGALVKRIRQETLPKVVQYTLKSPVNAYRVRKVETVDRDGVVKCRFRQKKGRLRPSERIRLFRILKRIPFADLAMSGGEATSVLARVKRRSLRGMV